MPQQRIAAEPVHAYVLPIALFLILFIVGLQSGGFEKYVLVSEWLFNPFAAILIPAGLTAFKLWRWKKAHPSPTGLEKRRRVSNLISIGILMTVVESVGYTFGFISGLFVESLLFDVHLKVPWTVAEPYIYMYEMVPLVASFYEVQLGNRHSLLQSLTAIPRTIASQLAHILQATSAA